MSAGLEGRVPGGECRGPAAGTGRQRGAPLGPWARASGVLPSEDSFDDEKWQVYQTGTPELGPKVIRAEDGAQIRDAEALL